MGKRTINQLRAGGIAVALLLATACSPTPAEEAQVRIGSAPVEFRVEVAQTADQQRTGLSGRDELSAGTQGCCSDSGAAANNRSGWLA